MLALLMLLFVPGGADEKACAAEGGREGRLRSEQQQDQGGGGLVQQTREATAATGRGLPGLERGGMNAHQAENSLPGPRVVHCSLRQVRV